MYENLDLWLLSILFISLGVWFIFRASKDYLNEK